MLTKEDTCYWIQNSLKTQNWGTGSSLKFGSRYGGFDKKMYVFTMMYDILLPIVKKLVYTKTLDIIYFKHQMYINDLFQCEKCVLQYFW